MQLLHQLKERAKNNQPIKVGLIGCGEMGTDIVTQTRLMPGIHVSAIAERRAGTAQAAITLAGFDKTKGKETTSISSFNQVISNNQIAITDNVDLLCQSEQIDVIIEATGNPNSGAQYAVSAIEAQKHIVMMNVEADVTVGPLLAQKANKAGVVYTLGAGDEPTATMELVEFAQTLGFPVIAAGKGKNNPLNFEAIPADYEEEAHRRQMNPRMLTEFVDGSKTMIEMTALANATGMVPDKAGMHGAKASKDELASVFCPIHDGGILSQTGIVDYSIGSDVAPGVFVIIQAPHERINERLRDLKIGNGPYYALHRPYHLTSLEVPLSAVDAVLNARAHIQPQKIPVAEAAAIAKCNLEIGTKLGRIGEEHYRGWIMKTDEAKKEQALPIGLIEGAIITKPIEKGSLITLKNCQPDISQPIIGLRQQQDALLNI